MLRLIPKLLAALVAVALLVVGALAVALPRLVNGEEFRAALRANAEELLGTPVGWRHLDVGIVPLRLTLEEPVLEANIAGGASANSGYKPEKKCWKLRGVVKKFSSTPA